MAQPRPRGSGSDHRLPLEAGGAGAPGAARSRRGSSGTPMDGYCGETSLISAVGLRAVTSKWTARALASPGLPSGAESSQLLLGGERWRGGRRMKLQAEPFDTGSERFPAAFLAWCRQAVQRGAVVILGVFNNVRGWGSPCPVIRCTTTSCRCWLVTSRGGGSYRRTIASPSATTASTPRGKEVPFVFTASFAGFRGTAVRPTPRGPGVHAARHAAELRLALTGVRGPRGGDPAGPAERQLDGEGLQHQANCAATAAPALHLHRPGCRFPIPTGVRALPLRRVRPCSG